MPEIFTKSCKINVIEYGVANEGALWENFKNQVRGFFQAFKV